MTLLRRAAGGLLVAFSIFPVYRLLDTEGDAPHRRVSVEVADATLSFVTWGTIVTLLVGWLLARLLPAERVRARLRSVGDGLLRVSSGAWAAGLGALSAGSALLALFALYRGLFTNVDEIASTLQARYMAAGSLAGTLPELPEAWLIPNMLLVPEGWVSHFPPGHLALLAAGHAAGLAWSIGPASLGAMVALWALALPRMLPARPRTARAAGLAVALSPFLVLLGAGSLSHASAGAAGALALYGGLRARDGRAVWGLLGGAAIGCMVATRPWTGIVLGTVATAGVWGPAALDRKRRWGWLASRAGWTSLGGLPLALALFRYNDRLFGGPLTLGYLAAFGERHRLGFHTDPWGYDYTPLAALGFTSTDLMATGLQLLETPLPLGLLVGAYLLGVRRLVRGAGLLAAWALVPVAANAFYWFHDARMLYEAAPAWVALGVLAVVRFSDVAGRPEGRPPGVVGRRLPDAVLWSALTALSLALAVGLPARLGGLAWNDETLDRILPPAIPPGSAPALVFVHASWNERLSATLQGAAGMRQDSVITTLRRNTNCALHLYTRAREARDRNGSPGSLPPVDLAQLPGTPDGIERPRAPDGTTLRMRPGEALPSTCQRELRADRFGAVALAPLLWHGDLPGLERGGPMFVRDLGPEKNARLLERFPERTPYVFVPKADGAPPELVGYEEAMRVLWAEGPVVEARR